MRQDSLIIDQAAQALDSQQVVKPHKLTPAEVISWMPKDATPAQLDSAIQAHIKTGEIHWSQRPDTLRLPGDEAPRPLFTDSLPSLNEAFKNDPAFTHYEVEASRIGVTGNPKPYTAASDNLITGLLLTCFVLALLAFQKSRHFIVRQLKHFFIPSYANRNTITETLVELRFQFFLVIQTCFLLALVYFFYVQDTYGHLFFVSQHQLIGIFSAMLLFYFLAKAGGYSLVNWTFFDSKKNLQWTKVFLFIISVEGVFIFPIVLLHIYFNISLKTTYIYVILVLVLFKMLTIYKYSNIFFQKNSFYLPKILYLCALEIAPILLMWTALEAASSFLKVNF